MKIIILAGGTGTRLWPYSRTTFPKQFLSITGDKSYLQKIIIQFLKIKNPQDIFIVTSDQHFHLVKNQAGIIHPQLEKQIIIEPERNSTGPAIALAVKYLQEMGCSNEECFFVSSSDFFISPEEKFLDYVINSEEVAKKGKIVTFGVLPNKPESGYGYIKFNPNNNDFYTKADEFIEKPPVNIAEEYMKSGDYLWNCGFFTFQIKIFLKEMENHAPEISSRLTKGYKETLENFSHMPKISIDHCLMEKSKNIVVIPMNLVWSDIGCWDSFFDILEKDQNQNVKMGNVLDFDTKNSLIIGGKKLISTLGLDNMIIVDTEDAIFLGKKGESQKIKQLVQELQNMNKKETLESVISHRPWGHYLIIEQNLGFKIKKIVVNSGHKLSLQFHFHRNEHWVVIKGIAKVTKGDEQLILNENESIYIPKEVIHRLENIGEQPLEIIEVQIGPYLEEDDIIRIDDDYGRTPSESLLVSSI